jgi:hypothetical protein
MHLLRETFYIWIAEENALYYALDITADGGKITEIRSVGENFAHVKPKWDSGFRLSFGLKFPDRCWDSSITWTRYSTKKNETHNHLAYAILGHSGRTVAQTLSEANVSWRLDLNELYLQISRGSYLGDFFTLKAHAGIVGDRINQNFNILQTYGDTTEADLGSDFIKMKMDFIGGGVKSGLDLNFILYDIVSVFGFGSASAIYGRFDYPYYVFQDITTNTATNTVLADSNDTFYQNIAAAQMGLGFKFSSPVYDNKAHFDFIIAWEQNILFGVNKMLKLMYRLEDGNVMRENSDLSLSGLTINARIDF